jgi:hypothetical protein
MMVTLRLPGKRHLRPPPAAGLFSVSAFNAIRELTMHNARMLVMAYLFALVSACVTLAPGADKVRITQNPADVSNCSAVGNIKAPRDAQGQVDVLDADATLRNQTIGLGGNTAFETSALLGEGVAYRCPQGTN